MNPDSEKGDYVKRIRREREKRGGQKVLHENSNACSAQYVSGQ